MVTGTLTRGNTSVTFDIIGRGTDLLVSRDVGKPNLNINEVGREDPRAQDYWSALSVWTIIGLLTGDTAYDDAQTLAESIIKPRLSSALQVDLSTITDLSTYDVVPNGASALTLTYQPGERDFVDVQLQLVEIDTVNGGSQEIAATITPDSGTGLKIERPGIDELVIDVDESVTRTVGRPGAEVDRQPSELPRYIDKNAPAEDVFEISAELTGGISESNTLIEDILRPHLGSGALRLHFLSNLYSLDAYDVVPVGSQAARSQVGEAGTTGSIRNPKIALRTVDQS